MDSRCNVQKFGALHFSGKSIAETAIQPVKDTDAAFLRKAKRGIAAVLRVTLDVECQTLAARILIHELRHRTGFPRQQATADQFEALPR